MTGRPANAIATSDVPLAGNISHYSAEQAAIACRISKVRRASISETKEARLRAMQLVRDQATARSNGAKRSFSIVNAIVGQLESSIFPARKTADNVLDRLEVATVKIKSLVGTFGQAGGNISANFERMCSSNGLELRTTSGNVSRRCHGLHASITRRVLRLSLSL